MALAGSFRRSLRDRARAAPKTIILPEGDDDRVRAAAAEIAAEGLARLIVFARLPDARRRLVELNLPVEALAVVDPTRDLEAWVERYRATRKGRELTASEATHYVAADPLVLSALMVAAGEADGSVAGAANSTASVLRAGLRCIGTAEGIRTVSSTFFMVLDQDGEERVLSFADCAVVPEPTSRQLADIAIATVRARERVVGDEARVAFLSFSTRGSARGPAVDRVREAVDLFRRAAPDVVADGELQVDAALVGSVGERKAPGSPVAGRANVLIFPDLDAGNIGYKLTERLAGANAIGPVVQGFRRPFCDLSRGSSPGDIVDVVCVAGLLAGPAAHAEA